MDPSSEFPVRLLFTLAALVLVLVLAYFVIRFMARMSLGRQAGGRLQILQTLPVGTRERLMLIRFDDEDCLIGVTGGGISLLKSHPAIDNGEAPSGGVT